MTSKTKILPVAAALSFALASVAVAQTELPYSPDQISSIKFIEHVDQPSTLLHADLDGDFRRDAIVLQGGDLALFFGVGGFSAPFRGTQTQNISAVEVLRGSGSDGRDILATVGTQGFQTWELNLDTEVLEPTLRPISGWETVTRLVAGDFEGDGVLELVGIPAGGGSVLIVGDPTGTPVAYPVISPAAQVFDVAILDALPDPLDAKEVAILTASNLTIMGLVHPPTVLPLAAISEGSLMVLRDEPSPYERLAIAALHTTDVDYSLTVVGMGVVESPLDLATANPIGFSVGDVDGDGLGDLAYTTQDRQDVRILLAQNDGVSTFSTAVGCAEWVGIAGDSLGAPLLTDMDQDGNQDLTCTYWTNGEYFLGTILHATPPPAGAVAGSVPNEFEVTASYLKPTADEKLFNDNIELLMPIAKSRLPSLECIVWRISNGGSGIDAEATRLEHIFAPNWSTVSQTSKQPIIFTLDETSDGLFPQIDNPDNPGVDFIDHEPNYSITGDIFFYEIRPVRLVSIGVDEYVVKDAGKSFFFGHFNLQSDIDGSSGNTNKYWPGEWEDGSFYSDPLYIPCRWDPAGDVEDDMAVFTYLQGFPESPVSVRQVDPSGVPLPKIPSVDGPGKPTTKTAEGPVANQ